MSGPFNPEWHRGAGDLPLPEWLKKYVREIPSNMHRGFIEPLPEWLKQYGTKVGENLERDFVEPFRTVEGTQEFVQGLIGPGNLVGGVVSRAAQGPLRSAAVRAKVNGKWKTFTGPTHGHAFMDAEDAGAALRGHVDDEGFIDAAGKYITRRQAKERGYFGKAEKDISQTVTVKNESTSKLLDALDLERGLHLRPVQRRLRHQRRRDGRRRPWAEAVGRDTRGVDAGDP